MLITGMEMIFCSSSSAQWDWSAFFPSQSKSKCHNQSWSPLHVGKKLGLNLHLTVDLVPMGNFASHIACWDCSSIILRVEGILFVFASFEKVGNLWSDSSLDEESVCWPYKVKLKQPPGYSWKILFDLLRWLASWHWSTLGVPFGSSCSLL